MSPCDRAGFEHGGIIKAGQGEMPAYNAGVVGREHFDGRRGPGCSITWMMTLLILDPDGTDLMIVLTSMNNWASWWW